MTIEYNKVTWYSKLAAVIVFILVLILGFYIGTKYEEVKFQNNSVETFINIPKGESVVYKNTDYGFTLNLPESWKGYTVLTSLVVPTDGRSITLGYKITLRNPIWTAENPTMDIPIQIFPIDEWNKWVANNFEGYPTAAPIGPSERGRNSKYVFATAPRYNFSYLPGFEDVEDIIKNLKTK